MTSNNSTAARAHLDLTHLDQSGHAQMVDVSPKAETLRMAVAEGYLRMRPETLEAILSGNAPKGDVLGTARLAGIMAAKQTSNLIPLCHPLPIQKVTVNIAPDRALPGLRIEAMVKLEGKTGVEMEAMTAVSVAALTLYDMAKALEKGMTIERIALLSKSGGKSGDYSKAAVKA
jgi:cyclic pyranopterin monophosphate synthase